MKLKHLINLQLFAKENNISLFTEAIEAIMDIIDSMVDAENETRFSIGGYAAAMVPYATMDNVEYFLDLYTPKGMRKAILCTAALTSMTEEEAEKHVYHLLASGKSIESIIDEANKTI